MYRIEYKETSWSSRSLSLYFVCPSAMMRYPQSSDCLLITFDAAHLKAHFGGVLYLFVHRNSDNKLSTLAFGVSNGERAADAARLVDLFRQCFPSLAIVVQDGGLALNSDAVLESLTGYHDGMLEQAELLHIEARENVVLGTCARHLAAVLASKHKNKDVTEIVHRLAKARTQPAVDSALATARAVSEGFYNDLEAAVDQLTLNYRLNLNLMSRDTTTQNNSESQNWSADDARCQGPVSLIVTMLQRMIEKHGKLSREYSKSSRLVPRAVSKLLNEQIGKQQKYRIVALHGATDTHIRANVAKKNGETVLVEVFWPLGGTAADIRCRCRFWNDQGVICGRVAFLMLYVRTSLGLGRWDPRSRAFLHASLSMANLKAIYSTNARFPSILPFSGDPSKILSDQMAEFGSLKCYPGDHKPRGKYDTVKRKKKKKRKRIRRAGRNRGGRSQAVNQAAATSMKMTNRKVTTATSGVFLWMKFGMLSAMTERIWARQENLIWSLDCPLFLSEHLESANDAEAWSTTNEHAIKWTLRICWNVIEFYLRTNSLLALICKCLSQRLMKLSLILLWSHHFHSCRKLLQTILDVCLRMTSAACLTLISWRLTCLTLWEGAWQCLLILGANSFPLRRRCVEITPFNWSVSFHWRPAI